MFLTFLSKLQEISLVWRTSRRISTRSSFRERLCRSSYLTWFLNWQTSHTAGNTVFLGCLSSNSVYSSITDSYWGKLSLWERLLERYSISINQWPELNSVCGMSFWMRMLTWRWVMMRSSMNLLRFFQTVFTRQAILWRWWRTIYRKTHNGFKSWESSFKKI